ncbi:MAG TPA: septation protein SepH, partial [Actinomycetes bacterium]|nr:septation protein SepH [Actinomycetes bacterium]
LVYDVEADGGLDRIGEPLRLRRAPGDHLAPVISVSEAREEAARGAAAEAAEEQAQSTEAAEPPQAAPAGPEPTSAPGARRRTGRRASVPSWDDILLGTRRQP